MRMFIPMLILTLSVLGIASSVSAEEAFTDLANEAMQNLSTTSAHLQGEIQQINRDVNLSNGTNGLVDDTLQNLSAASGHFQAGVRQINGDINLSNATTELEKARSTVEEFIRAFNDLIQIVNRLLGLVSEVQRATGNLS